MKKLVVGEFLTLDGVMPAGSSTAFILSMDESPNQQRILDGQSPLGSDVQEDRESLMLAMEENATKNPNKKLEIKLTLEDRDLVVTYSHVQQNPEEE